VRNWCLGLSWGTKEHPPCNHGDVPRPQPPHDDSRESALSHYNERFRHRYRLPALTEQSLVDVPGLDEAWRDIPLIRRDGVVDASCAILARVTLSILPRYAIGFLDARGVVHVESPHRQNDDAYRNHHVMLVNPLGGYDNWADVTKWMRQHASEGARRTALAGLASEERPDYEAIDRMLRSAPDGRARVLPPDEGFSAVRAAEVAFIYRVTPQTLRSWKSRYRNELAARRVGRPRNR
jgi:hypothetical protein